MFDHLPVPGRAAAARIAISVALVLALLGTYTAPVFAVGGTNGSIAGLITDASGKPVPDATVALAAPSGSYHTTTDAGGHFTFTGVVLDTYTISVTAKGFESFSQSGVTVIGDQAVTLPAIALTPVGTAVIGRTVARGPGSAFQPNQTIDTVTVSGQQVTEALGKTHATNQAQLITSAPGTQVDVHGNLIVRGSLTTNIGFNYDGVDYTSVDHGFLDNVDTTGGSPGGVIFQGFLNGIGSASVTPGSGDPTQGNEGSGYINLVPKRGTYPAFGSFDIDMQTPWKNNQVSFEYGFATKDNRFSNYFSFTTNSLDIPYGQFSGGLQQAGDTGQTVTYPFAGAATQHQQDFVDNFVFKFGPDQNQSLQLLYQTHWDRQTYGVGGVGYPYANSSSFYWVNGTGFGFDPTALPEYNQVWPLQPGQTAATIGTGAIAPQSTNDNVENISKIEYDNNFNSSTFLALRLYHINQQATLNDPSAEAEELFDSRTPNLDGGNRIGGNLEISKQFDVHNLVTFAYKYEVDQAIFSVYDASVYQELAAFGASPTGYGPFGAQGTAGGGLGIYGDFLTPANTSSPLTFGGGAGPNDCPVAGGCWLYYLNTTKTFPNGTPNPSYGFFGSTIPRMPANLLSSPPNRPQQYAFALRDQITINPTLHLDLGVRYEGARNQLPCGCVTGDVGPDSATNYPQEVEPRVSAAWQFTPSDTLRATYGRTADFTLLGNIFTPLNYQYYYGNFPNAPSSLPGSNGTGGLGFVAPTYNPVPGTQGGFGCGTGEAGLNGFPYQACASYADLLRWSEDVFYPDAGNALTPTYTNEDFSYSHQFAGGYSVRVTPYFRSGQNIPYLGVIAFTVNPTTGQINPLSFRPYFSGVEKATGVELYGTTPQKQYGFSGYVSATYTNAFSTNPPGAVSEDQQPAIPFQALAAGNLYHVGYVAPVTVNIGAQWKCQCGIRINPTIQFDGGYPYGIGNTTPVVVNGVGLNVTSTNNFSSTPIEPAATPNYAVNFVDPTNPGNLLAPNIYATRGTPETSSPGGELTQPRMYMNLTLEYSPPNTHSTFGLQVLNVFDLVYAEPAANPYYAPLATGVATYQTGQTAAAQSGAYSPYGTFNLMPIQFGSSPYVLYPNHPPTQFNLYYQFNL